VVYGQAERFTSYVEVLKVMVVPKNVKITYIE